MNVRFRVELSQAERSELTAMVSKGKRAARKLKRAHILLAADAGRGDEEIARTVAVGSSTVYRPKRRFVEGNLERALSEDPRPGAERMLSGKEEALLVATACASPPEGRARWTLELLAGAMRGQCLDRRIDDPNSLISEIAAWENNATPPAPASNGCSQPKKPAPKWAAPIPSLSKSHNHCASY